MAASATFALKAGEWFRRVVCSLSLLIRGAQRARCQAETPLVVLFRFLRPALIVLFARCASACGRGSIDLTGGDGTRDSGDTTSQGNPHERVGVCCFVKR